MRFFRDSTPINLPISMAGITIGNRLLVVGCGDPLLLAALAVKTGLTGRACAVDASEPRCTRAAAIAEREGALVESFTAPWDALPFENDAFDVAIVRDVVQHLDDPTRVRCFAEIRRVLRKGGRLVTIVGRSGGLFKSAGPAGTDLVRALEAAGFRAARTLAERGGQLFVEGVRGTESP